MRALLIAVLLAVAAVLALAQDDEPGALGITWRTDLAVARAEAAETGRPLMVVFR